MTLSSHSRSSRAPSSGSRVEQRAMLGRDVLHVPQPVVDQAERLALVGGAHAAAAVVSDDSTCGTFSASTANCSTDRQLRSVCTTTLATLRWTNSSPGGRSTIVVRRDAAVRAADPQIVRRLLLGGAERKNPDGARAGSPPTHDCAAADGQGRRARESGWRRAKPPSYLRHRRGSRLRRASARRRRASWLLDDALEKLHVDRLAGGDVAGVAVPGR